MYVVKYLIYLQILYFGFFRSCYYIDVLLGSYRLLEANKNEGIIQ